MFVHIHNWNRGVNRTDWSRRIFSIHAITKSLPPHYDYHHYSNVYDEHCSCVRCEHVCATCSIFDISYTFWVCLWVTYGCLEFSLVILVNSVANTNLRYNSFCSFLTSIQVHYFKSVALRSYSWQAWLVTIFIQLWLHK